MAGSGAWPVDPHIVHRHDADRSYRLWVATPMGYRADASEPHPLVVCCDAHWTFGAAVDTTRILSMSRETPRCADEHHSTVAALAASRGLRALYAD